MGDLTFHDGYRISIARTHWGVFKCGLLVINYWRNEKVTFLPFRIADRPSRLHTGIPQSKGALYTIIAITKALSAVVSSKTIVLSEAYTKRYF